MSFYRLMLRAGARQRWRSWLALTLLTALGIGLVLAGAQTARRTATAVPRYEGAHGYDAFFYSIRPLTPLGALPDVASLAATTMPAIGNPTGDGSRVINVNLNDFSLMEVSPGQLPQVVKLVSGHMPDQTDPTQVLASTDLAQFGIHLGSVLHIPMASPDQRAAVLASATFVPKGPTVTVRVVGTEVSEIEFPSGSGAPSYDLYPTAAFDRRYNPKTVVFRGAFVRLHDGSAGLTQLDGQARREGALGSSDLDALGGAIATSIDPQVVGWWILTALCALVGLIVLAQALARQAVIEAEEYPTLGALGAYGRQLFTLTMIRTVVLTGIGAVVGVGLATFLSQWTPFGEARLADPTPGFRFDPLVLLGGGVLAALVVIALGIWPAVRTARRSAGRAGVRLSRPSRIVGVLSASGAPPSALIGVRNALEHGRGRTAVPVSSALFGAVLAVTALCGTAVFSTSLTHLTGTPLEYGQGFSAWFSTNNTGTLAQNEQLLAALDRPGITGVLGGVSGAVTIDGHSVAALAGQALRGPYLMTTTSGVPPTTGDEVALGTKTMRDLGVHLGSTVRVHFSSETGPSTIRRFRVVGTTVLPPDFNSEGLGTGAIFALSGFFGQPCLPGGRGEACIVNDLDSRGGVFLVRAAPGPQGRSAMAALSHRYASQVSLPQPPTNLVNFGEAINFPLLFGCIVVLFGIGTLLHLLLTSMNRRRRETGLLKSLGMVRRQIALTVSWQTTTVAIVGLVIGIPLGIAAGRAAWSAFASNLGVGIDPVVAVGVIAAIALGTVLVANLVALVPSVIAARARAASLLRSE